MGEQYVKVEWRRVIYNLALIDKQCDDLNVQLIRLKGSAGLFCSCKYDAKQKQLAVVKSKLPSKVESML